MTGNHTEEHKCQDIAKHPDNNPTFSIFRNQKSSPCSPENKNVAPAQRIFSKRDLTGLTSSIYEKRREPTITASNTQKAADSASKGKKAELFRRIRYQRKSNQKMNDNARREVSPVLL